MPNPPDTPSFPSCLTVPYRLAHGMDAEPGDRVKITTGKYAGHTGIFEANVYQRTVDYPEEWNNGHHVMLDTGEVVTVRR